MTRTIEVADRSEYKQRMKQELRLDPARTVALTIDMQREYLDEAVGQSVVVPSEAERVRQASKRMLDTCRSAGIRVVHAYAVRRPIETELGFHAGGLAYTTTAQAIGASQMPHRPARRRPDRPEGSPESQVPAELTDPRDIHVTSKKGLDSFADTELRFLLTRILNAKYVLMSGINTDTCVYSTTFTAANLGFWPVVMSDCVASMRGVDSHEMALELMSRSIAWVLTTDELADKIAGARG